MRSPLIGAATLALVATASACSPDVTAAKVRATFQRSFVRLYVDQQHRLGKIAVQPGSFFVATTCQRGSTDNAGQPIPGQTQSGAGDDWACVVQWQLVNGTVTQATYDLSVRTDGCFEATGPSDVVGGPTLSDSTGREFVNPLAEIDACFAT